MDVPVPGGTNHLGHTDGPSGSSSSLLSKVKRQFSLSKKTSTSSSSSTTSLNSLREHLPKSLGGTPRGADGAASSVLGSSDVDEPTAYTIAPPDHREVRARSFSHPPAADVELPSSSTRTTSSSSRLVADDHPRSRRTRPDTP